jgi:nucleoside phosphorylase
MSRAPTTDVLVVAAFPPELAGLKALLGDRLRGSVQDVEVAAEAVGIGLAAAAAGTAMALRAHSPRCMVLVGTSRIRLASTAAVDGRGAFPGPMLVGVDPDASLSQAVAGDTLRRVGVATTLAITTDDALADRVGSTLECEVEHLEAFAVAAACARLHVPIAVVLGVANRVGGGARDEWLRHHVAAGNAATDVVVAWLRRGAPGVIRT